MTAKNSLCSEDIDFAVTDMYITLECHILFCSEGIGMAKKGNVPWNVGLHHSEETKMKISESRKGFRHTEKTKNKMSRSRKGKRIKPFSDEHKINLSIALKGRVPWNKGKKGIYSEDTIRKISGSRKGNNFRKGIKHSENTKKRLSEARKGINNPMHGRKHGLETLKKLSEWQRGEKSPHWIDGRSYEPYCPKFDETLKERIRERDNRTCQLCGMKENGQKLSVHHVHYDKKDCEPDLITLCRKCNAKVNFNRNYYENLFMEKLKERGILCSQNVKN